MGDVSNLRVVGAGPKTHDIMRQLQAITGSDRYRPGLRLRRSALLGLSAYEPA